MRSSSVKTAVAAVTLAAALIAAVPAGARPTQSPRNTTVAASPAARVIAAMKRLYNGIFTTAVPVIPLPPPDQKEGSRSRTLPPQN